MNAECILEIGANYYILFKSGLSEVRNVTILPHFKKIMTQVPIN